MSWPGGAALERAWGEWRPHLVHAATPGGLGVAARSAARRMRIPFVTSYHTSFSAYADFYRVRWLAGPLWSYLRWFHNSGLRTWCPTRAIASDLESRKFARTGIWGRGVDTAAFHPDFRSMPFRRELGIADHEFLVTYVGRLAREKGLEPLLVDLHHIVGTGSGEIRLMLVGDGPFEAEARSVAPPGTVFTGSLSGHGLAAAFASSDLFVFPSVTDTFGNVILDAMASGVPVLAADVPVTEELLGATGGFRYRAGASVSAEVTRIAADSGGRAEAARVALGLARSRTWTAVFDRLFAEYRELARSGVTSASPSIPTTSIPAHPGFVAHS